MKDNTFFMSAGEDLLQYRLVKLSGSTIVYADSGEDAFALTGEMVSSGNLVRLYTLDGSQFTVTGAKAIAAGSGLYIADDGKVTDITVGKQIGIAMQAINADGRTGQAVVWGPVGGNDRYSTHSYTYDYFEDFFTGNSEDGGKFSETADKGEWLKTSVDGDADGADVCKVSDDGLGGILELTCNDKDADNENVQLNGESFKLATGKPMRYETSVALKDVDKCDFFIGLAISNTNILGGVTDRIGFQNDHDGNIDCLIEQDSTEYAEDSGVNIEDCAAVTSFDTYKKILAFSWDGAGMVKFYIDGVLVKTFTDNGTTILIPDDEVLSPVFQIKTHTGAAAVQTAWIDYIHIPAER